MRYSYNRLAKTITVQDLDPWRADLRKMTKIYKSIPAAKEEDLLAVFREARQLFWTFKKSFESWVYDEVLPTKRPEGQSPMEREVATKAWTALTNLGDYRMFPQQWDYKTEKHEDAPWKVEKNAKELQKVIVRYQKGMNDTLNAIQDLIEARGGELKRRNLVENYQIGRIKVQVHNAGRDSRMSQGEDGEALVESELSTLQNMTRKLDSAGLGSAVDGLTVHIDFDRTDLRAGQYEAGSDTLTLFPLGTGRENNDTLVHEVGHRFYYRKMPSNARAYWDEVIDQRAIQLTAKDVQKFMQEYYLPAGDYPDRAALQREVLREPDEVERSKMVHFAYGIPVYTRDPREVEKHLLEHKLGRIDLEFISEYGATNAKEAFADAFRKWVLKGPRSLGPWTRDFFTRLTRSGGAATKYA